MQSVELSSVESIIWKQTWLVAKKGGIQWSNTFDPWGLVRKCYMPISSFRKWNNSFIVRYTIYNLGSKAIPQRSNRVVSQLLSYVYVCPLLRSPPQWQIVNPSFHTRTSGKQSWEWQCFLTSMINQTPPYEAVHTLCYHIWRPPPSKLNTLHCTVLYCTRLRPKNYLLVQHKIKIAKRPPL